LRLHDKESLDGEGEGEGEEGEEAERDRFVEACGSPFGPQPKNVWHIQRYVFYAVLDVVLLAFAVYGVHQ